VGRAVGCYLDLDAVQRPAQAEQVFSELFENARALVFLVCKRIII
jgi:hypothetical protein